MKPYGKKRDHHDDDHTNLNGWVGAQSRNVAQTRRKDTKMLHRTGRRRLRQAIREGRYE